MSKNKDLFGLKVDNVLENNYICLISQFYYAKKIFNSVLFCFVF